MRELVTDKLSTLPEKPLDEISRTLSGQAKRDIKSVLYNAVEQVVLGLAGKDLNIKKLDARKPMLLDTKPLKEGMLKRLLALSSLMMTIAPFLSSKKPTKIKEKKYDTAFASKLLVGTVQSCRADSKSLPSRCNSGRDKIPHKKSTKPHSIRRHRERGYSASYRHMSLSYFSKEQYESHWEFKSKDNRKSMHNRHIRYHRAHDFLMHNNSSFDNQEKCQRNLDKDRRVMCPVTDRFRGVLEYRT